MSLPPLPLPAIKIEIPHLRTECSKKIQSLCRIITLWSSQDFPIKSSRASYHKKSKLKHFSKSLQFRWMELLAHCNGVQPKSSNFWVFTVQGCAPNFLRLEVYMRPGGNGLCAPGKVPHATQGCARGRVVNGARGSGQCMPGQVFHVTQGCVGSQVCARGRVVNGAGGSGQCAPGQVFRATQGCARGRGVNGAGRVGHNELGQMLRVSGAEMWGLKCVVQEILCPARKPQHFISSSTSPN